MAANIHHSSGPSSPITSTPTGITGTVKPELINRIEGGSDDVSDAKIIHGQDAIITISQDRSVRVWLLRDSGQYWPSICHYMNAAATALVYHHPTRQLFVGTETGLVSEFILGEDFNHMDHKRDYHAHQNRVSGLYFSSESKWILSIAKDRHFQYHCTDSGRRVGGYLCPSWCTSLAYDELAKYVFVGDYSGQITVLKLDQPAVKLVNTLKGHSASVQTLFWEDHNGWLCSGSFDASVFVWDIAGRKGTVHELHGHRQKVTSLAFSKERQVLLSGSEDNHLVLWNMATPRIENPEWAQSDLCQLCSRPFFWNMRAMYEQKQIGLRQHHCRKCGKAICNGCSTKRSTLPSRGHEFPVRVCEECYIGVTDEDKRSNTIFHDLKHSIKAMDIDFDRNLMITVGSDRIVKLWAIKNVL